MPRKIKDMNIGFSAVQRNYGANSTQRQQVGFGTSTTRLAEIMDRCDLALQIRDAKKGKGFAGMLSSDHYRYSKILVSPTDEWGGKTKKIVQATADTPDKVFAAIAAAIPDGHHLHVEFDHGTPGCQTHLCKV